MEVGFLRLQLWGGVNIFCWHACTNNWDGDIVVVVNFDACGSWVTAEERLDYFLFCFVLPPRKG